MYNDSAATFYSVTSAKKIPVCSLWLGFLPVSRITDYSKSYKLRKIFVKFLEGEDLWTRRNGLDFGGDLDEIKYFS